MTRHPLHPWLVLAVAVGGALGAGARWALEGWQPTAPGTFPWTTFSINISGTVVLALLPASRFVRKHQVLPPALGTGVLGGFTTMSTFSDETRALVAGGHTSLATAYVAGSVAAGLLAVALVDRLVDRAAREQFQAEDGDL